MAIESVPGRPQAVYKTTIARRNMGKRVRRLYSIEYARDLEELGGSLPERPRTYGDCEREGYGSRVACPWAGCGYHLALDVLDTGSITFRWPDREVTDIPATCALAVANRSPDGLTLKEVGELANITRERVRQIETEGLRALRSLSDLARIQDEAGHWCAGGKR